MVLEGLGTGLKSTLRKITGLGVVDKEAVEATVRDLQRALLQADADVSLVAELSARIKKKVLGEKPPAGMTVKEYFVKILYDELVSFLGEEKGEIQLKGQRILVIGLFGSGKCVHPESNIVLSDGDIITAEELYEKHKILGEGKTEGGKIINVSDSNLFVPSFNPKTLKTENKRITHLWKLEGKDLLEVKLDNGNDFSVKVTPEHPFFVMRRGELMKIRADNLNADDFVAIPRSHEHEGKLVDLYPSFSKDLWILQDPKTAKKRIVEKHGTLMEACKNLKIDLNYCKFTSLVKKGIVPLQLAEETREPVFKLKIKNTGNLISFPRYLTADLAEFLGYVIGDGYVRHEYVQISNEDPEIIKRASELSRSLFGIEPRIRKDERTKGMYVITIASITLVKLLNDTFGLSPGKKGKNLKIPPQTLMSQNDTIRAFLKAYFDCDSHVTKGTREIELTSESRPLISQVASLLLRFGIVSTISKKMVNNVPYWRLSIRARYAETYAERIGFRIRKKRERVDQFKRIGIRQGCGKHDMIPLAQTLKNLRQSLGFSIGKIQDYVTSYGRYEGFGLISRESLEKTVHLYESHKKGKMMHLLKNMRNEDALKEYSQPLLNSVFSYFRKEGLVLDNNDLTFKGAQLLKQSISYPTDDVLNFAKGLADSDVCWTRVNEIIKCENEKGSVYDLTVEDNHSFIADNIIVHNTTSIGKLAKWFKTRGLSVGVVGCDVHRPAAQEQLKQLAEKVDAKVYLEGKGAEGIAKEALKAKEDVLIFDSAGRDALDEGLAKELKSLGEIIKPDEVLLVLPADIGQAAKKQATEFNKLVGITGIVVTKLDGTARGGGALAATAASGAKVKFIGVGEKPEDLEIYDPQRFVSRLIGYGDIQGLLDKAKEAGLEKTGKRLLEEKFTLDIFYEQIKSMQGMGSLSKMVEMIPGVGKAKIPKGMLDVQEGKMKKWKFIIESMTPEEKEEPEVIKTPRISRIAKGSGSTEADVRELMKYYKQAKKIMKMAKGGKGLKRGPLAQLAKQFGMGV